MDKPWKWDEAGKVRFANDKGEVREFTLVATDPEKVARFQRTLWLQAEVAAVLWDAKQSFVEGRADYRDAADKLEGIITEWGVASNRQHVAASEVSKFFMPDGVHLLFGPGVNLLTDFANETVDRLVKSAANEALKAAESKAEAELQPHEEPQPEPVTAAT